MIQIWEVPSPSSGPDPPKLVYGIVHDAGLAWQLSWHRHSGSTDSSSIGILAAAMGNGTVHIYSIPDPSLYTKISTPVFLDLSPISVITTPKPVWCLHWGNGSEYPRLYIGTVNGFVYIYEFSGALEKSPHPNLSIACCTSNTPVRSITTCEENDNLFAVANQSGIVEIWDLRNTISPVLRASDGSKAVEFTWVPGHHILVQAGDNGLRATFLVENGNSTLFPSFNYYPIGKSAARVRIQLLSVF